MTTLHSESPMNQIKGGGLATLCDLEQRSNPFMPAEAQWSFLKEWTLRKGQVMMRRVEKLLWWWRPDLAFRWVSLSILLSSGNKHETLCAWKDEPEQLPVFYIHRKGGRILFGSSCYSVVDICLKDIDLWLQSGVLNSMDVEQGLVDFSVCWWRLNVLWQAYCKPPPLETCQAKRSG